MTAHYREVEFLDPVFIEMNGMKDRKIHHSIKESNDEAFVLHYDGYGYLIGIEIPATKITVKGFISNVRDAGEPQTADI
jgi:hypothetical protein